MGQILTQEQARGLIRKNNIQTPQDIKENLKGLFKDVIQEVLEAEMNENLGYERYDHNAFKNDNYRNGYGQKTVNSELGEIELDIPRDRNGEFEPKIIPKRKRNISGIEGQIISLYARGMTTRDIHDQMNDLYGIEVSAKMISKITDKLIPIIKENL